MFHHQPLLPALPSHLKNQALEVAQLGLDQEIVSQVTIKTSIDLVKGATYERFAPGPEIISWCQQNIYSGIESNYKIGIQIFHHGRDYSPHVDGPRGPNILNYLLQAGGTNVETLWYKENNKPVHRDQGMTFCSTEDLVELHRTRFEENSWFIMQSNVIHSVINLESPRIALSIGLSEEAYKSAQTEWYRWRESNLHPCVRSTVF